MQNATITINRRTAAVIWDAAMMPFAINAATPFIGATKTPEYLAGACPAVSTRAASARGHRAPA